MRLLATIDYWDGSAGKTVECEAEQVTGSAIIRSLWTPNVASITFTRVTPLTKIFPEKEIDT
ncbi:hypothetical protein vBRpoSV10_101 [Ruegeria phage vB_RpoS-V10]|nr:hypothetical protein vBRpoSV10_101 [Ruegeria phage vB_RpoS-V10]